jgi:methanogenic corrinoid protein MtbC1
MKKLSVIIVMAVASFSSYAQSSYKEDVQLVQSIYGKSKSDLVRQYMNLSDAQSAAFTKVYENYETERKTLGEKKLQLINDYAQNYATLTEEKADELAKGTLKNNQDYEKLYSKTYGQIKKAIGAINAAKFIQLEVYLQTVIRNEIQETIPFIGELDKTKVQM